MRSKLTLVFVVAAAQIRSDAESVPAVTCVAAFGVRALAVDADVWVDIALIDINAKLPI